jgi:hypothetical protein
MAIARFHAVNAKGGSCAGPQTAGNSGNYPPEREGSVSSGAGRWKAGVTTEITAARVLAHWRETRAPVATPIGGSGRVLLELLGHSL